MNKIFIENVFLYDKKNASIIPLNIERFELKTTLDQLRLDYIKKHGKKYLIYFVIFEEYSNDKKNEVKDEKINNYKEIKIINFNPDNLKAIIDYNQSLNNY
jgi:hypothetical protein